MFTKFSAGFSIGAAFLTAFASIAFAEDVTLKSVDGAFALTGELLDFDGENYLIKSVFGEVNVSSIDVDCVGESCPDMDVYVKEFGISGSGVMATSLMPALLKAYSIEQQYGVLAGSPGGTTVFDLLDAENSSVATITVASNNTVGGMDALANGRAVLAMASRDATVPEAARINDAGLGDISNIDRQTIVALDGLVILFADSNPVRVLSAQQIGNIFAGNITNWAEVGGVDHAINVYQLAEGTDNTELFRTAILANTGNAFTQTVKTVNDISAVVARDPNGIGFSNFSNMKNASAIAISGSCGIATAPSEFTIKSEEYPLTTRLAVYTPDITLPGTAQGLVDYMATVGAQNTVADAGFVNQYINIENADTQRMRFANAILSVVGPDFNDLRNMATELRDAERLSVTFRFDENGTLDARGQGDLSRLTGFIAAQDFNDVDVLLVGFTASQGAAGTNVNQSEQLAQSVAGQLGNVGGATITAMGFGGVAPLACADVPRGAQINQRVEVWTRNRK